MLQVWQGEMSQGCHMYYKCGRGKGLRAVACIISVVGGKT